MTVYLLHAAWALLYMAGAFLCSLVLTRFLIFLLPMLGYMDIPHGRHEHETPVPRGGGIAIVVSFGIVMLAYFTIEKLPGNFAWKSILPASILFILGILDDRFELSGKFKLSIQILTGISVYWIGGGIERLFYTALPVWIGLPLTVIWCVAIINAFNLIDGLDGLAAGISVVSALSIACWNVIAGGSFTTTAALLIFSGSCLGFLRYNFSPAKIFMGDTGSMFLGLFFAVISMHQATKSVTLPALLVPLIAIGIPIFDVFLAVWRRFVRKLLHPNTATGIMEGDHDHLHHRIQAETGSQRKTTYILYGVTFLAAVFAIFLTFLNNTNIRGLTFFAILAGAFIMIRIFAKIEIRDSLELVVNGLKVPRRSTLMVLFHPFLDLLMLCAASLTAFAVSGKLQLTALPWLFILILILPPFIITLISGVYSTYWLRASLRRCYLLARSLLIGFAVSLLILSIVPLRYIPANGLFLCYYLYILTAVLLILGERLFLRYAVSEWLFTFHHRNTKNKSPEKRIVVYGGGLECDLYLRKLHLSVQPGVTVCGILDENPALRHLNVCGLPVLGDSLELEQLWAKYKFDTIILTVRPKVELQKKLMEFCRKNKIQMFEFKTGIEPFRRS